MLGELRHHFARSQARAVLEQAFDEWLHRRAEAAFAHVVGQCVTGDTLLRIRRRRKRKIYSDNGEIYEEESFEYLKLQIKDVQAGDEVLSLNEAIGEFEYRKIIALKDMGVKPVYELATLSGRKITTTGNHPYLVREYEKNKNRSLIERGLVDTMENPYLEDGESPIDGAY